MRFFLTLFFILSITFNVFSQTGLISDNSGAGTTTVFNNGSGSWPYVFNAALLADGVARDGRSTQNAQTLKINITSLPDGGANYRIYRTNSGGNGFTGSATALTLGLNTISAAATAFDRTCKFQFSSGDIQYDAIYYNNDVSVDDDGATIQDGDINSTASPSLFSTTSSGSWPRAVTFARTSDGASSQLQQVIKINVTKLDGDGANYRVYKSTSGGGDFFGSATNLDIGLNTITVSAVAFDRSVKIQFSQDSDIEVREMSVNNAATDDDVDSSVLFADTGNASYPRKLPIATNSQRTTSQGAQTLKIFITKLPGAGANHRNYITYRAGGNGFSSVNGLTLGLNTITQAAVDFNRDVVGQFSNNEIEFSSITLNDAVFWDGSTDTDWDTAANWSNSTVPTSSTDVLIRGGATNYPIATNVTVDAGQSINISKGASLKINGNLTNNGTIFLDSDSNEFASIIVGGTSSGNITYSRYVNQAGIVGDGSEWDLIGSPVDQQSISSFATTNTAVTGTNTVSGTNTTATLATNGSAYAVGEYDNSNDTWTNFTTGTVAGAGDFDIGKGYQMGSVSSTLSRLHFTGTIATTDILQAIIDNDAANSGAGRRWSLIANPFPSFLNANSNADGANNFLTVNASKLHDSYEAIYGYDGDGSGYTVYNQSTAATYIAPGQGFFVASASTSSDDVTFSEDMQTITGTDDFVLGDIMEDDFELILKLYEGDTEIDYTRFYFKEGLNLNLDPGYDAGHFNQEASIMSRFIEEDEGVGFVINAMGIESVNNAIIPLEVNREAGSDFRISIDTFGIYAGTNVYLEDNQNGTMTLLNEEDFILSPESNLSDAGRFFVHLTQDTFSNEEPVETNHLNAFKFDTNNFITIEGLASLDNQINVSLYNIIGKEVLSTVLANNTNTQTVSTLGLSKGIYIIKLESGNSILTKKLIIK